MHVGLLRLYNGPYVFPTRRQDGHVRNVGGKLTVRKKKKKSSTSADRAKVDADISQKEVEAKTHAGSSSSAAAASGEHGGRRLTESERRFEEVQKKRVSCGLRVGACRADDQREERARKNAHLSHKERVSEFNSKLDRLTWVIAYYLIEETWLIRREHHDMPKVCHYLGRSAPRVCQLTRRLARAKSGVRLMSACGPSRIVIGRTTRAVPCGWDAAGIHAYDVRRNQPPGKSDGSCA